ncbi:hypothetical protein CGT68_13390 [Vibrio cholerae]|nr:hypothetical protein CGT69_15505 [Vibrio cholerae]PAS43775.1 hypothetical protein CGT68_13390 [Vibrio cholerae]
MALTKGQPMAVQICSRQICHSLAATCNSKWFGYFKASGMKVHRELDISPLPLL